MKFPSSISNSEWHVPLKILLRMIMLIALAGSLYIVVAKYAGRAHPHRYLVRVQHAAADDPSLILFGDSVLFWKDSNSADSRSLEERIMESFPEQSVVSISKAASNPEFYLSTWRYLRRHGAAPKAALVELNLRTFSSTLYARPDSEFPRIQYEMYWDSMVSRALYRPLAIFQAIDTHPLDEDAYRALLRKELADAPAGMKRLFDSDGGAETRWNGMTLREHYYLRYAVPLSPTHPALLAVIDFAERLRSEDVAVLFFLTPIDVALGREQLGPDIEALLDNNRKTIRNALAPLLEKDPRVQFYDASKLLPSSSFMHDYGLPNEHLHDSGLTKLSEELEILMEALLTKTP